MATSYKARSYSRPRTQSGSYSNFGSFWGSPNANANGSSWGKTSATKKATKSYGSSSTASSATGSYKNVGTTLQHKINSYKTLFQQCQGTSGRFPRPTPSTLNSFANWINKGALVQTVSAAQVARWAQSTRYNFSTQSASTASCKNVLAAKFGKSTIKAVCRGKSGAFLVATAETYKGRWFSFPR